MNIIACVDNNMGMAFNNRRQSKDSGLRKRIAKKLGGKKLFMNAYSAKQFNNNPQIDIVIDDRFLEKAGSTDYCFVETGDICPYTDKIESIVLYKWNRDYPSDLMFSIDLSSWRLVGTENFKGTSHEIITEEIYVR